MARLIPWRDPVKSLEAFRREMDRLFDKFFEVMPFSDQEFVPSVDISETDQDIIVQAEIPGINPKDLDISLNGRLLTIKGEKKSEHEEKKENYHKIERKYGAFSRTLELPADVDPDKVEAVYKDGVLKITLPKTESGKKIEVKTSE
jgi:HSP20 family protein